LKFKPNEKGGSFPMTGQTKILATGVAGIGFHQIAFIPILNNN
jgi:hypothetical protein